MKALNIAILVVAVLILLIVAWHAAGGKLPSWREHFGSTNYLTITWSPPSNYPFPGNLNYNWAFCMQPGTGCKPYSGIGTCASPAGDPSTWQYHGTVAAPSLTLNSTTCEWCEAGCKSTLMLQAVDTMTKIAGSWVAITIDLSSPTPKSVAITDASGQPLAEGSTAFVYTLTLDPAAFGPGNTATLFGTLLRGSSIFAFDFVPFTSASNGVGTYSGSFTSSKLWSNGLVPGPLQAGDMFTIAAQVFSPAKDGPIYYFGNFTATAETVTPGSPSLVSWMLV